MRDIKTLLKLVRRKLIWYMLFEGCDGLCHVSGVMRGKALISDNEYMVLQVLLLVLIRLALCTLICLQLRLRLSMLFVLRFKCKSCLSVMRVVVRVILKLFVRILASFRLMRVSSVLNIWGVLRL